jgi:lipopolysaccharide biosynthesis glycosyltransferase
MSDIAFLTIYDKKHGEHISMLRNSLKNFHPDIPLIEVQDEEIDSMGVPRPHVFYIAAPLFANKYLEKYKTIIKLDSDQIITGSLKEVIEDPLYDVGCVYNYNRMDAQKFGLISVWDVPPQAYVNNGFVVLRSKEMVKHWITLCSRPNIVNYPMREQDILNIIAFYGNYRVKMLDEGPNWYGLAAKADWNTAVMKEGKIVIPQSPIIPMEKTLKVIHFAGGEQGAKMNYQAYFQPEVTEYIDSLIK